jgi:DNA-binding response OmpR family regulator
MASNLLKGKQILALDDEQDVLDILGEELDEHGVEFDSASAHKEATQRPASLTYDLVIRDIMGVRGFELLEHTARSR